MPPAVESMAYRLSNGVPWHRLGTPITEPVNARQIMEAAEMLYENQLVQLSAKLPDGTDFLTEAGAIFSNRTGMWEYINTVKKMANYRIVQNEEIAEILDTGTEENPALSEIFEVDTAGVLADGKQTFISLKMGKDTVKFGVDGNDEYETNLLICNDFSGNGQLQWANALTRTVCQNTLIIALNEAEQGGTLWTFPHRNNPLALLKFRAALERNLQSSRRNLYAALENMVNVKWNQEDVEGFARDMYPEPKNPKLVEQRDAGIGRDIPKDIFDAVNEIAEKSGKAHDLNVDRMKEYRAALVDGVARYADEFSDLTMYAGFQAATEFINWRVPERGDWKSVAESVMFDTRRKELDRLSRLVGLLPSKDKRFKTSFNRVAVPD